MPMPSIPLIPAGAVHTIPPAFEGPFAPFLFSATEHCHNRCHTGITHIHPSYTVLFLPFPHLSQSSRQGLLSMTAPRHRAFQSPGCGTLCPSPLQTHSFQQVPGMQHGHHWLKQTSTGPGIFPVQAHPSLFNRQPSLASACKKEVHAPNRMLGACPVTGCASLQA